MMKQKRVDVLVNAAGITHYSPLFVTSPSLLEEVVRTNLMGTMIACRTIGKNMMAIKKGKLQCFFTFMNNDVELKKVVLSMLLHYWASKVAEEVLRMQLVKLGLLVGWLRGD
jgi:short-subunit dehydrogenase